MLSLDDPSATPLRLAEHAAERSWTVAGDQLYFMSGQAGALDLQLEVVNVTGGAAQPLAEHQSATGPLAADASGVYWGGHNPNVADDPLGLATSILKYEFSSKAVIQFAQTVGEVRFLQIAAGWLAWADRNYASISPADGSHIDNFASGDILDTLQGRRSLIKGS